MAEPNKADFFFSKVKAVGQGIGNVARDIGGTVRDIGGTVANAATNVVVAVKDLPNIIDNSDFEKIKAINQVARQHTVQQKKKFTDHEWQEAERRADAVLAQFPEGYFESDFDPVKFELEQLSTEAGQEEIDAVVERLTVGVEKASGKLSRHVMKKRDQLIHGINTVASVEDDLRAAFMITRTSRSGLKQAGEEIMRNLRVTGQTRRKRGYMELLEVCMKIKRARDLQQLLKRAQESGEYGEAILLCVQCFQGVETLRELSVSHELRATIQRLYVETLQRLDDALTVICGEFDPTRYSKLLEGYMLQGIQGKHLAEKVLQSFNDAMHDVTMRVVRSMLLTKPKMVEMMARGLRSLEGGYSELCEQLPVDLLRPCLQKLMEVIFDVVASYHSMAAWHAECLQQQANLQQQQQPAAGAGGANGSGHEEGQEDLNQSTITNFLEAVCEVLAKSRAEVFVVGARRVMELLNMPGLFKGEDFLQVVEWFQKFLAVGEAFVGMEASNLRAAVTETTNRFLDAYHRGNIETLTMLLHNEPWKNIGGGVGAGINLEVCILDTPFYTPGFNELGAIKTLDEWLVLGNPFTRSAAVAYRGSPDRVGSQHSMTGSSSPFPRSSSNADISSHSRQGESVHSQAGPSGRSPSMAGSGQDMLTVASQESLKYIKAYCQLLKPLSSRAEFLYHAICEVFDTYLLSCFIQFSGVSLQTLVFEDDILPQRLKNALMRILTAENSRYRPAVEELQKLKPLHTAKPPPSMGGAAGLSILDRFAGKMESIASDLERSVDRMKEKLTDKVQSMPSFSNIAGEVAKAMEKLDALSPQSIMTPGNLFALHERIVAAESLVHIANELKAGRTALAAALPASLRRDVDALFSPRGTIEASSDLKETLFRGGARKLLQAILDPDRGTSQQIVTTNFNLREPAMQQNPWAEHLVRTYTVFKEQVSGAGLPQYALNQMWEYAILTGTAEMVDGISRVRRCTLEGRAAMSLDLAFVDKHLKMLIPEGFVLNLHTVDQYIRAFYLPWEDLSRWCQIHFLEYGKYRILALVELMAEAYKVKRAARNELVERIEAFSSEFNT